MFALSCVFVELIVFLSSCADCLPHSVAARGSTISGFIAIGIHSIDIAMAPKKARVAAVPKVTMCQPRFKCDQFCRFPFALVRWFC